jgi:molybdopterin converting factor small subunit
MSRRRPSSDGGSARVLLFATARTAVGRPELEWPLPLGGTTTQAVGRELGARYPALVAILRHSRLFLNGQPVRAGPARVREGDELAIHPPYGGG